MTTNSNLSIKIPQQWIRPSKCATLKNEDAKISSNDAPIRPIPKTWPKATKFLTNEAQIESLS